MSDHDPFSDLPVPSDRRTVGAELARLRHQRGLTGRALGELVGMSQAKISKIEVGSVNPTPQDVERIARALDVDADQVAALVEQAEGLQEELIDLRLTSRQVNSMQRDLVVIESRARFLRVFQPAIVPGLLQTTEYARAVLSDYAGVFVDAFGEAGAAGQQAVPQAVTARVARQETLYDTSKTIHIVMMETVFLNRVCRPEAMVAQVARIREVAGYPNLTVGIVPTTADLAYPPMHGFHLGDDRSLLIDLSNTAVASQGREVLRVYRTVFDHFAAQATVDIGPILDRYTEMYAELARPST